MSMKTHNGLLGVVARERPPEMPDLGSGMDWKFETRALAEDFRHCDVEALASEMPTISIFDYIGDDGEGGGVTAKRIAGILRAIGDKDINVEMNSPGGNYFEGVAIYNLFRRHAGAVNVQILGIAASAASVIAMAGDTIAIAHNAEIMIHEARGLFFGTKSEMAAAMETLTHVDEAMVSTYAARSGRPAAEFSEMIAGKDVYLTGQEAIDLGLADVLLEREAKMPVYADAKDDLPKDISSLDKLLAKQGMARSERRELYKAIKGGTSSATPTPATPSAGNGPEAFERLRKALTV